MGRIKLLVIAGGIGLLVFGIQEMRLASGAEPTPQVMSCADLGAKGPGNNAHVTVSKFLACTQSFVYESGRVSQSNWKKVWIPLVPLDGEYMKQIAALVASGVPRGTPPPPPSDIRVLLKSTKVKNEGELGPLGDADTITGVITNKIESLGAKEKKILEESYPGIDFTKCYILDHDRKPAGAAQVAGLLGGGTVVTLLGGVWVLAGRRKA